MPKYKTRKARRKQRGGAENWNPPSKYTKSMKRKTFTLALYNLGSLVLSKIKEIPWKEYTYTGPETCIIPEEEYNLNNISGQEFPCSIIAKANDIPYYVFGGAACELFNRKYKYDKDSPNLHKTTDLTADIDILVIAPSFKVEDDDAYADEAMLKLIKNESYTPLSDHYTRWLFEKAVELAQKLAPHFNTYLPSKEDLSESEDIDLYKEVGPILVSRFYYGNMIKIQLTTKIGEYATHFLEFILPTDMLIEQNAYVNKASLTDIDGILVQNIYAVMMSQIKALQARINIPEEYRHKLLNHYGRLIYLSKLLEYTIREGFLQKITPNQLKLLKDAAKLFNNDACLAQPWCSAENYLAPLNKITYDYAYRGF